MTAPRKIHLRQLTLLLAEAGLLSVAVCGAALAQSALPQGGKVSSGQAVIGAPSASVLTITQSSNKAVIDWGSFSIGSGNSVTFVQPSASSATLNRVGGSMTSTIAGQLSSNGQVFLVNPNGIFITPTGTVQAAGGFVASTLAISNADFNGGYYNFTGNGASAGVSNAGSIVAGQGTYVALLGGTVSSSGTIDAYLGRVGIASGEQVILNPTGDGFLQVAVPTGAVAADGRALIDVAGRIKAAGGEIQVSAASAQNVSRDVINISGNLAARTVSGSRGNIILSGGLGGDVTVSGQLSATGGKTQQGGSVAITGSTVNLRGARINASGGTGGGTINVGGGWQGSGSLQRATTTNVDAATTLRADATVAGNGGQVTVWADNTTTFSGYISAQGGPQGGNGGNAEVSGKLHLYLNGDYTKLPLANLKAPLGETGNLLFDPGTVNIVDQASLNNNTALNGPDTFTAQFISSQLSSANVTISTNNATGANGAAGDINLLSNAQIAWSSNSSLTLSAARNITFASGASITGTGSSPSLVLKADSAGAGVGTISFAGGTQVSLPNGTVDLYYNPASNRTVANGGSNNSAGTVNGTSYTGAPASENWSSFISAATQRAWMLVNNVFDLQNIANVLNGNFVQGKDIDASATPGWNSGAGFSPIGTNGSGTVLNGGNGFTGIFDGAGHVIEGLAINRGVSGYIGLFGNIGAGASIQNVGLTNASIVTSGPFAGALVGYALAGSSITNSYSSGSIAGTDWVGGLVGRSAGTVASSYSTTNVSGDTRLGGLLGETNGGVSQSWASGSVTGSSSSVYVGGLVGYSNSTVTQSYATGAVSGALEVGGLVGNSDSAGSVSRSYATGSVAGTNGSASFIGGLVGLSDGSISESYATGSVSTGSGLGGLVGKNSGAISSSYFDKTTTGQTNPVGVDTGSTSATGLTTTQAFTQSSYSGWDFTNTWWMQDGQTRPFLRSEYSTTITNSHQLQLINMSSTTLGASYTLRGSLDLSETSGGGSAMWTTSGFVPLGTDGAGNKTNSNNGFTGTFDGAGNSIDALSINRAVNYVGLFGAMGPGGLIQNVGVTNASVTGSWNVGALVGHSYGTVFNSFSSGSISLLNGPNAGGLVGGQINGVIDRSYSTASVSGVSGAGIGGLLGTNNAGTVSNSYAAGSVNNTGTGQSGGLVGANINGGVINRSYATGSVTSSADDTGGLLGNNSSSTVTESYATGSVSGGNNVGGLIGLNSGSAATSYFDNQTTGQSSGVGSGSASGVNGLSTATFQNGSLPSGFSATAWTPQAGQYPQLSLSAPQTVKITATDSSSGSVTYGSTPSFSYTVTDTNGTTLCTNNCAAYFSGTPLIDSTINSTSSRGTSAPGYIAKGTVAAVTGYVIQFVNDAITVVGKALTITASDQSKTYGQTLSLGNSAFTTAGLVNGDTVSSVTLNSAGAVNTAGVAGSPYSIIPSNAVGTGLSNYVITYANGHLTVSPAPITVTALGGSSTYGSSPSNPGLSATGLQNGQSTAVLTGLSNSFGITNNTNAGSYTMNVAGVLTNANYTVTGTNTGSWTVNPAPVTVTALGGSSTYGSSPSDPGLSATGLKNGQSVAVLTGLSNSFGITNNTNAGSYTMNVAGVLSNANYTVSGTNTGTWNVNPAPVVVTALGGSSTYGSSPSDPGLSATGLKNGETIGTLTGLSNSFGITNTTNAGSYTMNVAGVLTNPNYTVSTTHTNPWTVNPATVDVTALGGNSSYGTSPANPGLSATGLQNGETPAVLTGLSNSFGITNTTPAGSYAMNVAGTLTNGNYVVNKTYTEPWTVFPAGQAVPPYVPPPPTPSSSPSTTGSISSQLQNGDMSSRIGISADSMDGDKGMRSGVPAAARLGGGVVPATIAESPNASPAQDYSLRVQSSEPSGGSSAMASAGGGDKTDDCSSGSVSMSASQKRSGGGGTGCAAKVADSGAINITMNELTRNAVIDSVEGAFTEMMSAKGSKLTIAKNVTAGTTLVVTAGIIGWLLRGGALLSALLSSMPLWREFDPMVVVQRRREDSEESSQVERIFDNSGAPAGAA